MQDYIHPCADGTIESEIESKKELRQMARELYHVYGLRVIGKAPIHVYRDASQWNASYVLADEGELPVGRFFLDKVGVTNGVDDINYCFHTPYYQKDRGSDQLDRHTIRSKKLSALMRTLNKHSVVSSSAHIYNQKVLPQINKMAKMVANEVGGDYGKSNYINVEEWHKILLSVTNNKPFEEYGVEQQKNIKHALDNWGEIDKIRGRRTDEIKRFFNGGIFFGVDMFNNYLMYDIDAEDVSDIKLNFIKRVNTLEEYPDVQAVLTMFKTWCEENNMLSTGKGEVRQGIPSRNDVYKALDVVTTTDGGHDVFGHFWVGMPKCV
jgi:hypothetical protein